MFNISTSLFNIKYLLLTVMVLLSYENYAQKSPEFCPMDITPDQRRAIIERDQAHKLHGHHVVRKMTRDVPVKIHIVRNTAGDPRLSPADAMENITAANAFFSATDFNFYQCGEINYIDNNTYDNKIIKSDDPNSDEHVMANGNKVAGALNVFFCRDAELASGTNASWSSFPDDPLKDWIIMRNTQSDDLGANGNKSTFAHEVGHWFDLFHTFSGNENVSRTPSNVPCFNCTTEGDMLCDTPAENNTGWIGCAYNGTDVDPCGEAYNPLTDNLMSYANADCYVGFTNQQITRMHTSFDLDRASSLHGNNCAAPAIFGCTNPNATNYNPSATVDDGSCNFIYCSGTQTLTAQSGSFNDGSGAPEYGNNSNCKWLIQPNGINSFILEFTSFFLEENYDYVRVYDGTTTSAPLLGSFSQFNILPPNLTTSTGAMLVHFTTDGATTSFGWAANYYPITNPCQGDAIVDITSNPIPSGDYFASNKIITSNPTVSNPTINMTAGKSIELTEGFDGVSNGPSVVEMKIEPCVNNLSSIILTHTKN